MPLVFCVIYYFSCIYYNMSFPEKQFPSEACLADLNISTMVCQYIDNSDDPLLNFNGTSLNMYEFSPKLLYDYHRGGILPCIRSIIAQYEFSTQTYIRLIGDKNVSTIKQFKITQYVDPMGIIPCPTPSLGAVFVGSYTNQAYANSMITCCFKEQTIYITFAGTNGVADLWTDADFITSPMEINRYDAYGVAVHNGALHQLLKNGFAYQLVYTVLTTIRSAVLLLGDDKPWTISVSGYSLGAMHAQLFILFMNDHILNRNGYAKDGVGGRHIDIRYKLNIQGSPPMGNKRFCQILSRIIAGKFVDLPLVGGSGGSGGGGTIPPEVDSVVDFNTVPGEILSVISYNDPVVFAVHITEQIFTVPLLVPAINTLLKSTFDLTNVNEHLLDESDDTIPTTNIYGIGADGTLAPIPDLTTYLQYFQPSICYYANFIPNIYKYHSESYEKNTFALFEKYTGMRAEDVDVL